MQTQSREAVYGRDQVCHSRRGPLCARGSGCPHARGITVTAFTPGYAHLGATAQAIPRPEHDRTATVSILAVPCHRDEMPAHDIAAALATKFRVPVAASCGFHVEAASDEDIQKVLATTKKLISSLEEACAPFFADTAQ